MNRSQRSKAQRRAAGKYFDRIGKTVKPKESKLDPVVKEKWLTALRSGDYEQTQCNLKFGIDGNCSFCCLGVLLDVMEPNGWERQGVFTHHHRFPGSKKGQRSYPNQNKMKEIGLYPSAFKKLALMNDEEFASFNQIANYIEKNL